MGKATEHWERVRKWREQLATGAEYPVLNELESSWQLLDKHYDGIVKRADEAQVSETLLGALFYHVDMGFYPPPELLLALMDCYHDYMRGAGKVTLEQAFFGSPRRKGGTHARRRATRMNYMAWGSEIERLVKSGKSRMQAAEHLSELLGGRPEPESILRLVSKHYPFRRRRTKKRS